ncbi:ROK family protein [Tsuneonella mangrovi]|uniref:ROK family protein n=1 Tax=Tsuneonella mangrovi TaxID=1982042 RepID=UPI000BA2AE20|nr:ROK family protein [Tsuneonella mangrovi]
MGEKLIGAVEAGGTKFILALARSSGDILARTRVPTTVPAVTFAAMREFFDQATGAHGPIASFGIASFGPIDIDPASSAYGTFTTTPKPGWSGARFHDALAGFGAPITVDTDVNGAALGEWHSGAGQGCGTLAYTTIGTGIGTGLVRDGRSLMGFSHYESGHIRPPRDLARDPYPGKCPFHADCLEGLASGPAIADRWGASLDQVDNREDAVELIGSYIAHLAAALVLLHMPDRLIFGGGVMHAPGLIASVRRQCERQLAGYIVDPRLDDGLERYIVAPGLGDDAGITGAIELGRQALGE